VLTAGDSETTAALAAAGLDGLALKPTDCSVAAAATASLPAELLLLDYEGREHLPDRATLAALAEGRDVRLTAPVRADGFDPLGDDARYADVPDGVGLTLVAGHAAYLTEAERSRAIAPRLGAARERFPGAWVGTEGVERLAMAAGGTQYDLLGRRTERELRALRAAGHDGDLAVYAPVVLTDDEDATLDAVGGYVARRAPVARALPDGAPTDATATGRAREVLLAAADDYALVGSPAAVADRVDALGEAGADAVVGYPARGVAALE
jgi:hypothetical protein